MKKILSLLILGAAACVSAQTKYDDKPFNNSKKEFNDWSVSAFGWAEDTLLQAMIFNSN